MRLYNSVTILEIDSGRIEVPDNTWTAVAFGQVFGSIPNVVCTLEDCVAVIENVSIRNITVNGFEVHQELKTASTLWIQWIAINGG